MEKVITLGSATYDIFLDRPSGVSLRRCMTETPLFTMPVGAKLDVAHMHTSCGGGALNSTYTFHRLGFDALPCCTIGIDPAASFIRKKLVEDSISLRGLSATGEHPTSISCIISADSADATLLVYRGASNYL